MEKTAGRQLTRESWIQAALSSLQRGSVEGIKIVGLAKELGVTSGSFYWHFKDLNDLLTSALEFWEVEMTDRIMIRAESFEGTAQARILGVMVDVIRDDAAAPDHAISVWARQNGHAREVYKRTLEKRFSFSSWMFEKAGFDKEAAALRGRLFVVYLMGETSTDLKEQDDWEMVLKRQLDILIR